ncbi:conserved hypothetical protein [Desulforapulum autotrophicum HRM2]|uniref:Uncharacterized protein n=1 Tax=Desulforapulum autotrophicum (strain ATCC 43914 / DSM 3382 / VKM B-1955 / HRM2) TaxID=177437 RepID=C0QD73_DESAH|nr:conserved hypothetical protein [Desulforapulum autotrophicum HRM2]
MPPERGFCRFLRAEFKVHQRPDNSCFVRFDEINYEKLRTGDFATDLLNITQRIANELEGGGR